MEQENTMKHSSSKSEQTPTVLEMTDVVKKFGSKHTEVDALKGISITVHAGEFVSIVGPSGSGKSTFLTIAGGLQSATSGTVLLNGADWSSLSEHKRSRARFESLGFILQGSNLVPFLRISEQFAFLDHLRKKAIPTNLDQLLTSLDIDDLRHKYPKELSGGERERVAIAKALYNDPSLILADEPTASLDSEHAFDVVKLLAEQAHSRQKAIVMVTHDERMTAWSDTTYRMRDGELAKAS
jgi:putative ABC transport system ATP-binding protein